MSNRTEQNAVPNDMQKQMDIGVAKYNEQWIKNLIEVSDGVFITIGKMNELKGKLADIKHKIDDLERTRRI